MNRKITSVLLYLLLVTHAIAEERAQWPSFLGIGRAVSSSKPAAPPLSWSKDDNLLWQVSLPGYGQSSPVVWIIMFI
jgi:outer membrane protein assembly factor BamB